MAYDYSQGMKRNLESEYQGGMTGGEANNTLIDETNPKDVLGAKKLPLDWVPPALIISAARAFKEGGDKYGPFNWRSKKVKMSIYIGAILRHILAILDGEDADPESPIFKEHIDGIIASAGIIVDAKETGNLIDDRPPKGPAAEMIRRYVKK